MGKGLHGSKFIWGSREKEEWGSDRTCSREKQKGLNLITDTIETCKEDR